ncbi:MAG: FAD-dependent thymidylate synthase [Candidatus Diapherotrites archaeon]|nr:FAD-dependent thymidylate synthase [Candidatus Diapherotrites archaeon]
MHGDYIRITFFEFNHGPERMRAVEEALSAPVSEPALRQLLDHSSAHFVVEQVSRLGSDLITEGRDSYSHQSQRYVTFREGMNDYFTPESIRAAGLQKGYDALMQGLFEAYSFLVGRGIPAEDARFVFALSFNSHISVTVQGRKLVDFFAFCLHSDYGELRAVGEAVLTEFGKLFPNTARALSCVAGNHPRPEEKELVSRVNASGFNLDGVTLLNHTLDPVSRSAMGASICYKSGAPSEYMSSFDKDKQEKLIRQVVSMGHHSVIEHSSFTFGFPMSRVTYQQLRRHRLPARSHTDLASVGAGFEYVTPPSIAACRECAQRFSEAMDAIITFREAASGSVPAVDLGYVLPNAVQIDVLLTSNARDLMHILNKRLCQRAQWEIRAVAYGIAEHLIRRWPVLFDGLGPDCFVSHCREGKMSCSHPEVYRDWRESLNR